MPINETSLRQELHKWIDSLEGKSLLDLWRIRRHMTVAQGSADLDPAQWINTAVAAPMLGVSVGHLNRLCINSLHASGHAKKAKPATGGKAVWFINKSYDPILLSARSAPAPV